METESIGNGINTYRAREGLMCTIIQIASTELNTRLMKYITAGPTYCLTRPTSSATLLIRSPVLFLLKNAGVKVSYLANKAFFWSNSICRLMIMMVCRIKNIQMPRNKVNPTNNPAKSNKVCKNLKNIRKCYKQGSCEEQPFIF